MQYQVVFFFFKLINYFFWLRHVAHGILVPRPGIEPVPPVLEVPSLNHWTTREVPTSYLLIALIPQCFNTSEVTRLGSRASNLSMTQVGHTDEKALTAERAQALYLDQCRTFIEKH